MQTGEWSWVCDASELLVQGKGGRGRIVWSARDDLAGWAIGEKLSEKVVA